MLVEASCTNLHRAEGRNVHHQVVSGGADVLLDVLRCDEQSFVVVGDRK